MSSNQSTRGRGRGRGRGGKQSAPSQSAASAAPATTLPPAPVLAVVPKQDEDDSGDDLCWICANPPLYLALGPCNHRTCHICALRLRALYKNQKCAFCKEDQPTLIFTTSLDKPFADYAPEDIPYKDAKLNIAFESEQMLEETLILLRFNCSDPSCDYVARGWGDLGLHARSVHGRVLCDICISTKKVFAHEHTLYTPHQLSLHMPEGGKKRPPKNNRALPPQELIEGDQPHPACLFCHRCFYGPDELYKHMREIHEDCFLCKRDGGTSEYFLDYNSLEHHFNTAHYPCSHKNCLANKFVVFVSQLDLRAHIVSDHAGDMSAAGIRDARRIEVDFEDVQSRRGRGRGRGGPSDRGAGRGGTAEPPPNRGGPPGGRRREGFGTSLTTDDPPPPSRQPISTASFAQPVSQTQTQANGEIERDPAVVARHTGFLNLLASKASRPNSAIPSVKSAIRSWKAGESSARDLISHIHAVLDENLESTAIVINAFIRLLDGDDEDDDAEDRKRDLLKEWRGFEVEHKRQFPSLVPTLPESGGASQTPGRYAAITGGRAILNAKHHTTTSGKTQGTIWNRVEQAASSSNKLRGPSPAISRSNTPNNVPNADRFPPLAAGPSGSSTPGRSTTPWASSTSAASKPAPTPLTQPQPRTQQRVPKLASESMFPSLAPSASASQRDKPKVSGNVSLKNILGTTSAPPPVQWGSSAGAGNGNEDPPDDAAPAPKGKKGKGKQTLFTLGSFPT